MAVLAGPAHAGQEPYVAVVGVDSDVANFYIEPTLKQFTHDTSLGGVGYPGDTPLALTECLVINTADLQKKCYGEVERFTVSSRGAVAAREICNIDFAANQTLTNYKYYVGNAGWYEWVIRLPKKPNGNIHIVLQCGLLKPNAEAMGGASGFEPVLICAGEEGERDGAQCSRLTDYPGQNPVVETALPKVTAMALARWDLTAFNLTAYRNPSSYAFANPMVESSSMQILDGAAGTRVGLTACTPKTLTVKIPVTGQVNSKGQTESDLEIGDLVYVKLDVPREHRMDIYCHAYSAKLVGLGEPYGIRVPAAPFMVPGNAF
jgi:hypothetical protein